MVTANFFNISYIGFMQVIRADMTCLGYIFPELKVQLQLQLQSIFNYL